LELCKRISARFREINAESGQDRSAADRVAPGKVAGTENAASHEFCLLVGDALGLGAPEDGGAAAATAGADGD
jgi:hypothetical protein